jgi:zinc D-Ala-D-Ala carboxypeptidase
MRRAGSWASNTGVGLAALVALTLLAPLAASARAELPHYSGDELGRLFSSTLEDLPAADLPEVTGDPDLDARIRHVAEGRGYRPRPVVTEGLVPVDGELLLPEAAEAWTGLQEEAAAAGHHLRLVAGHRDVATQRSLFLARLAGHDEASIDSCLRWTAPPGYSKHHTGLAVDIADRAWSGGFGSSPAYAWLAADDYRNAKRFGFIPSYPPDAAASGPEPEPWEWVYVGVDTIVEGMEPGPPPPPLPWPRLRLV